LGKAPPAANDPRRWRWNGYTAGAWVDWWYRWSNLEWSTWAGGTGGYSAAEWLIFFNQCFQPQWHSYMDNWCRRYGRFS
jgi:hypothetical protein